MTVSDFAELSKVAPEKSLLEPLKKNAGRNNTGRITVRHQGGETGENIESLTLREIRWYDSKCLHYRIRSKQNSEHRTFDI